MSVDQLAILGVLVATIAAFLWGRYRHDVVAIASLLACAVLGLTPPADVFSGFSHPAVITVACVLVLSQGLLGAGAIDLLTGRLFAQVDRPVFTLALLLGIATCLSAFMNNVGALALLMPVGLKLADKAGIPAGKVLMPLAFSSILGGMTTLIGTPPNLIVAGFRDEVAGRPFAMFDFAPVGVAVVVAGLVFLGLAARFLVPARGRAGVGDFPTEAYVTEVRVPDGSKLAGLTLGEVERLLGEADAMVIGLVRAERRIPAPSRFRELHAGDVLQIRADHDALVAVLRSLKLELEEAASRSEADIGGKRPPSGEDAVSVSDTEGSGAAAGYPAAWSSSTEAAAEGRDQPLTELVVLPGSVLAGRTASDIHMRTRYGINLLAVSRQGEQVIRRLRELPIRHGDVLLMQGEATALAEFSARYGCAPLASRALRLPIRGQAVPALLIMAGCTLAAGSGVLAPATAFAAGVLAFVLLRIVPARSLYQGIDWPVIVLLGALIPVAAAMSTTGAAELIARGLVEGVAQGRPILALTVILIVSMTLSDFMNNAATAAVMCPIAIGTAAQLGLGADPFLMAVAVGASCAFLTPIGHQNNTLILGPGGFRFGDYWRLGLPLEIIVVAVGVPLIALVWPLAPA